VDLRQKREKENEARDRDSELHGCKSLKVKQASKDR
jgi:hypothetical protein